MRELLQHRGFRLILTAQLLAMFGNWSLLLVFGIWVKSLTGSNPLAGMVVFAMAAPALIAPLGAVVVDRVPRRGFIACVSAISAAAVLTLWAVRGPGQVWLLFAVAVVYGFSTLLLNAAVSALLQDLLPEDRLGRANAAIATVRQGLRLIAPLAGAALFTVAGGAWVATLNAVTFLAAAALVLRIRAEGRRIAVDESAREQIAAGLRHILITPVLRRYALVSILVFGGFGLIDAAIFAMLDGLHQPPTFVSLLATAQGAAAIVAGAAVTAARRIRPLPLGVAGTGLAAAGLALETVPSVPVVFAGIALVGAALPLLNIAATTLLQLHTPNALLGRAAVALDAASSGCYTAMIALGAVLIGVLPYQAVLGGSALAAVLATAVALRAARRARGEVAEATASRVAGDAPLLPPDAAPVAHRSPQRRRLHDARRAGRSSSRAWAVRVVSPEGRRITRRVRSRRSRSRG